MPTTNSGGFNVTRTNVTVDVSGNWLVTLIYSNATTNKEVVRRVLLIPANSSLPITDQDGNIVAATVPGALSTALTTALSQIDSNVSTGASGNKLNL